MAEKDRLLLSEHLFKRIKLMSIPSGTDQIKEKLRLPLVRMQENKLDKTKGIFKNEETKRSVYNLYGPVI